ncbi:MAG: hypothetical protein ACLR4Z_16225 [Butyricicoccaceae bacterium]
MHGPISFIGTVLSRVHRLQADRKGISSHRGRGTGRDGAGGYASRG